ncbi:MAG: CDP-alcohol phosphatidyltransferase family protein [Actinomycetes bacterium]
MPKKVTAVVAETRGDLSIHALTVTGILAGMAALVAVLDKAPTSAVVWLIVALIIDGVDGPIARKWLSESDVPRFDGYILDLVIDYVTCVIVPAAFMWQFGVVSHGNLGKIAVASVIGSSALWFSQTDIETSDHYFRGFPAAWNMIIPTLWLLDAGAGVNIFLTLMLSILTLSNIEFAHTIKVARLRTLNILSMTAWVISLLVMSFQSGEVNIAEKLILLIGPLAVAGITTDRALNSMHTAPNENIPHI